MSIRDLITTLDEGGGQGGGGLVTKSRRSFLGFTSNEKTKFHFRDFYKHRSVTKSETISRFSRQQKSMLTQTHFTDFNIRAFKGQWKSLRRGITKHYERLTMVHKI